MLNIVGDNRTNVSRPDAEIQGILVERPIVLVGMMGAGKSAVGRRLAQRLSIRFVDADEEIVKAADGMTISEIFERFGETHFRSVEARVIGRLLKDGSQILATGGGAMTNAETRAVIRSRSVSIWLKAELRVLLERITRKGIASRPMLKDGDPARILKRLMDERDSFYAEADLTVCSRPVSQQLMVNEVLAELSRFLLSSKAIAFDS
jgi:shikimate kinase